MTNSAGGVSTLRFDCLLILPRILASRHRDSHALALRIIRTFRGEKEVRKSLEEGK